MTRRMADPEFLATQEANKYAPNVLAINSLCDVLMKERPQAKRIPYVAPHYDATTARILSLSSNPGPLASGERGSGFLSIENDDGSAERMGSIWQSVGLTDADALPWNAYPWHVHDTHANGLTSTLIDDGLGPIKRVLELHPSITAVVAHGGDARQSMKRFVRKNRFAAFAEERGLRVWETRHTSNRAFILSPYDRAIATEKVCDVYREAMRSVGLVPQAAPDNSVFLAQSMDNTQLHSVADTLALLSAQDLREAVENLPSIQRTRLLVELLSARST